MRMSNHSDTTELLALDELFSRARAAAPEPDPALLARIVADAQAVDQLRRAPVRPEQVRPAARPERTGWFVSVLAALGGWPAMGSLTVAAVAGLWIGVAPPDSLAAVTGAFGGVIWGDTVTLSLDPAEDVFGLEG